MTAKVKKYLTFSTNYNKYRYKKGNAHVCMSIKVKTEAIVSGNSNDLRTHCIKSLINSFISPVNLVDVVNQAGSISRQGRNQQCYTCTDIRRCHGCAAKPYLIVQSYNRRTRGITK